MKWIIPPRIKVLEALGAIADGRVEINGNAAKVFSSSKGKFYIVTYDPEKRAIMTNDNGSYWRGYLGYPAIAFLMLQGVIAYRKEYADALAGIPWKDINQQFKNDFAQTESHVREILARKEVDLDAFEVFVQEILSCIRLLNLDMLGPRVKPPEGY